MSGTACAIPAIMATKHQLEGALNHNPRSRFYYLFRTSVYMILISLVLPNERLLGINYRG